MNPNLIATLDRIEALIPASALAEPSVSKWSVGQHVQHMLLAHVGIAKLLNESVPGAEEHRGFNIRRMIAMGLGWFPRGRAKAPPGVIPDTTVEIAILVRLLKQAREAVQRIESADPKCWFRHHILGVMSAPQCLRFLAIHNHHHLKILRDIMKRAADSPAQ